MAAVLLGHGKYRHLGDGAVDAGSSVSGHDVLVRLVYALFCLCVAIVMLNIAVTILSAYMEAVKTHALTRRRGVRTQGGRTGKTEGTFDKELHDFVWLRLENVMSYVFSNGKSGLGRRFVNEKHRKWWMK